MILKSVICLMVGVFIVLMSHAAVACTTSADCDGSYVCCPTAGGGHGCFSQCPS